MIARLSVVILAVVAGAAAPACGQLPGDCSGGPNCGNGETTVDWTGKKATEVARTFSYRPMVKGHMTNVHCWIVARYADHEATTICRGVFVSPPNRARRFVARFSLGAFGSMRPYCSTKWTMSPYCTREGHVKTPSER